MPLNSDYEMKPLRLCEGTELYKTFGYEEKEFLTDDQSYRTRKIESIPYIMVYYNKKKPDELLGTLLFSSSDNKIVSWVRINQGGYFYYLTFNMI